MKVAVIGSRTFTNKKLLYEILNRIEGIDAIISGGAKGADSLAEVYAKENNLKTIIYKPEYEKHGKSAPFVRNRQIINDCDIVVAFWDGASRGTKYTMEYAEKQNKKIYVINYK